MSGDNDRGGLAIDRLVSALHRGLMPKLGAATATRAALTIAGYGGDAAIGLDAATAALAGALPAADFNKLHNWPVLRLNYIAPASADLSNGAALTLNTWTTVGAAQSFTVNSTAALLVAYISGNVIAPNVANTEVSSRVSFDGGAATVMLGGGYSSAGANPYVNALAGAGAVPFTAFTAGTHTIAVQIYSTATGIYFCRPQTQPNSESLRIVVVELQP
jgi:hypothetical protein